MYVYGYNLSVLHGSDHTCWYHFVLFITTGTSNSYTGSVCRVLHRWLLFILEHRSLLVQGTSADIWRLFGLGDTSGLVLSISLFLSMFYSLLITVDDVSESTLNLLVIVLIYKRWTLQGFVSPHLYFMVAQFPTKPQWRKVCAGFEV